MNKKATRIICPVILAVFALAFCACDKNDATRDYGFPLIYMPQATVTGLDNSYPVPGGPMDQYTSYNCNVKDGKLNVVVGVMRSGYISKAKGFSVNLGVNENETERKLAEYSAKGTAAMALPTECCHIPAGVNVPEGESGASCYVSIDLAALAAHKDEIRTGEGCKLLVLGLGISNPTAYELAKENTSIVMVIDPESEYWQGIEILPQ